jgi:Cd2+/Zn2+-exporting ATPase
MLEQETDGKLQIWLTVFCAIFLLAGILSNNLFSLPYEVSVGFYVFSYLSGGYSGFVEMLRHLRRFELNIDFLMIFAAIGAAVIDQWIEGATLLFLFSLSGALETYALGKSRNAIQSLLKLRPSEGLLKLENGSEKLVPIEQLEVGQIVIVKPGEYIPIDGTIVKGETSVNEATITGESMPISKQPGDTVFAATLNENGVIELKVTRQASDTTVAKIIQMVEDAQKSKAKTQRFLDTFEPRYALSVVISVILLIFIPWLVLNHDFDSTFYRAMTILVVASPCALIISTPASIISAIANGAKNGVLFKGGAYVEQSVDIDIIAFDKTGTLTKGEPEVTNLMVYDPEQEAFVEDSQKVSEMVAIAAGCELHSEHHLAQAIVAKAKELHVEPLHVENMQAIPGQGVEAFIKGNKVSVGNSKMYSNLLEKWPAIISEEAAHQKEEGKTVVFVVKDSQPIGLIALADVVREDAKKTISRLQSYGVKHVAMLTGDNEGVAKNIAAELNIDHVYAELLPDEKVEIIKKLREKGVVAMVGDGVNDAPALAVSDIGIAMGAAGTDVALETADIVLMGDDLTKLPYLLWLSRKAKKVVWQNIIFSLSVIALLVVSVFTVQLPLTLGVIGHEGSTLLVVLNGLRLLKGGDPG